MSTAKRRLLVAPSMACADFGRLGEVVHSLESGGADALHFDFCDGSFAPTFLFSPMILRSLRPLTSLMFEAHMYCEYPSRYIGELAESGVDRMVVQIESLDDYRSVLGRVQERGMKAGIGILPRTEVPQDIEHILPQVSVVIANTVGPAYASQPFDQRGLRNIASLNKIISSLRCDTDIGADGGVSIKTLDALLSAGANMFVLGTSSIFHADADLRESLHRFRREMQSRAARH